MLGIYLPTYNRPHKLKPVADNIKKATKSKYRLYFGIEPDDKKSQEEAEKWGLNYVINQYTPSYSNALQSLYEATDEDIFFWANDDFLFLDEWDVKPLEMLDDNPNVMVLGVHDGNPKTSFRTISFIRRKYIEEQSGVIDIPNRVLYPYHHNFVDDELTNTAIARGVWDACPTLCIQHQHPSFTWLGEFPTDSTYKKNDKHFAKDAETYNSRMHLWQSL